jgi:hypothetical protein
MFAVVGLAGLRKDNTDRRTDQQKVLTVVLSDFALLCDFASWREPIPFLESISRKGAKTQSSAK